MLNQLYKYTPLQSTFGVQMLALVDGEPRLLSLKRALQIFIEHRQRGHHPPLAVRAGQSPRPRAHPGRPADRPGQPGRRHPDHPRIAGCRCGPRPPDGALQAERAARPRPSWICSCAAWLPWSARRSRTNSKQTLERIAYLEDLLANPKKILALIQDDLSELAEKYGDDRRTHIAGEAREDFSEEDLVPDEAVLISITQRGYIKRVAAKVVPRPGPRRARRDRATPRKEEDEILMLFPARTLDTMLFFSDRGQGLLRESLPDPGRRPHRPRHPDRERAVPGGGRDHHRRGRRAATSTRQSYCTMATRKGKIKRVALSEFAAVRPSGLIAITLEDGDELGWVRLTNGKDEIILVTEGGQALRFSEEMSARWADRRPV